MTKFKVNMLSTIKLAPLTGLGSKNLKAMELMLHYLHKFGADIVNYLPGEIRQ